MKQVSDMEQYFGGVRGVAQANASAEHVRELFAERDAELRSWRKLLMVTMLTLVVAVGSPIFAWWAMKDVVMALSVPIIAVGRLALGGV